MKLVIPAMVERRPASEGHGFRVDPVFSFLPEDEEDLYGEDGLEERAVQMLEKKLAVTLRVPVTEPDHSPVVPWSYAPECQGHRLTLRLDLRRRTLQGDFYVVSFPSAGRRLVVLPRVRGVCFEWKPGTDLAERASAVLREHFRAIERESDDVPDFSGFLAGQGTRLVLLTISPGGQQRGKKEAPRQASLGAEGTPDGETELTRTGRPFEADAETPPVLLREEWIEEFVARLLRDGRERPMLVVTGAPGTGKTAIIREALARWRQRLGTHLPSRGWLVSPQRIISGMSHLGQWEARWLAILSHMARRRHVLVLDDLAGLFHAGRSSASDLSLGHVLKAQQERDPVAVVAECTPEVWARLREQDRGFADLFHVLPLREPEEHSSLRILVRTMQTLESGSRVRFDPDVLPMVLDLQRRYARTRAFPGKAVDMLRALAAASPDERVDPAVALHWFCERTGFSLRFLDHKRPLARAAVTGFLRDRIAGQQAAVEAMTDVVMLTRAQLNDPARPLGTLLFTGPTGVGKTECAKALAAFVFGTAERMLRFDMNEFNGPDAVDRLTGGFGRPGQLTAAVRRQPCGVLLLDEIEKAHPDVFDLLLQVLGEGRLTDAAGQTADFCNCIIILTSNLGAAASRQVTGFQAVARDDSAVYREAAERFFRPEFFNRLDRVVPFTSLGREEIARLAGVLARRALERPGLRARQLRVQVDEATVQWLGERGFDAKYGARALRRAVEENLVEPLAAWLTGESGESGMPVDIRVGIDPAGRLKVEREVLCQAASRISLAPVMPHAEIRTELQTARAQLEETGARLDADDFYAETGEESGLTALDAWYYSLRDELNELRYQLLRLTDRLELAADLRRQRSSSRAARPVADPVDGRWRVLPAEVLSGLLGRLRALGPGVRAVTGVFEQAVPVEALTADWLRLQWRIRRLQLLADPAFAVPEDIVLERSGQPLPGNGWGHGGLDAWPCLGVLQADTPERSTLTAHGLGRWRALLSGTMAQLDPDGQGFSFLTVRTDGAAGAGEVLRLFTPQGVIDFRTGLVVAGALEAEGEFLWALLPPEEDGPELS